MMASYTRIATEVEVLNCLRQEKLNVHCEEVAREEYERLEEIGLRRWLACASTKGDSESTQEDDG